MSEGGLQALLDRAAIADVLHRFCRGVDRCDWDLVRDCYHPDAYDDHGTYRGDVDGLLDWMRERHGSGQVQVSMHALTNILVDLVDQDTARVESQFHTVKVSGPDATATFLSYGVEPLAGRRLVTRTDGRYLDTLTRRGDGGPWRILRRMTVVEATTPTVADGPDPFGPEWQRPRRDARDPLYELLAP